MLGEPPHQRAPPDPRRRLAALESRTDDRVVEATPRKRDQDEGDLDEEGPAVRRVPQVVELGQPFDRDERPGSQEQRDQHDGDPGEAEEGHAAEIA